MRRVARSLAVTALALGAALAGCQSKSAVRMPGVATGPAADVARLADARERSERFRAELAELARGFPQDLLAPEGPSSWFRDRLRTQQRAYVAIREPLFQIAFLHASAIVEEIDRRDPRLILLRASLSLAAGTELVRNFRALANLLGDKPRLQAVWNQPLPAAGIPAGSWEAALAVARHAAYQDLFRDALARLRAHGAMVEGYREAGDSSFVALYSRGVATALEAAAQSEAWLRANGAEPEDLAGDQREIRALVARSRSLRGGWAAAAAALQEAVARDGGMVRGDTQLRLLAIQRSYFEAREPLYALAFKHAAKLTRPDAPYPRGFRARAIGVSVLAAVTLYENAHAMRTEILAIPGVRPLLNQGDPAGGIPLGFWDRVDREFARVEYRRLLETGLRTLEQAWPRPDEVSPADEAFLDWVGRELETSQVLPVLRGEPAAVTLARALRHHLARLAAQPVGLVQEGAVQLSRGVGTLAGAVGDLLGLFETRKGKLHDQPDWVRFVEERVRPGDLLLEKSAFTLTDKLIPGHFGHVAMYVGGPADLGWLGLLTDPRVARHLDAVRDGKFLVEAVREGTRLATVADFLNVDDVAVLRPKPDKIPPAHVARAVALAFAQVGKRYDFAFDNNTWTTIVCSELAFHTYVEVPWPFARVLSSYTITPDDVGVLAGSDPSRYFELVAFVHDGRVVHDPRTGREGEREFARLLGARYLAVGD